MENLKKNVSSRLMPVNCKQVKQRWTYFVSYIITFFYDFSFYRGCLQFYMYFIFEEAS